MAHAMEYDIQGAFALPPADVPLVAMPEIAPVWLQRMTLEANPVAFALADIAFSPDGKDTPQQQAERQTRWVTSGRAWYGWLHARAGGNAWVARAGTDGPIIGYARAIRDPLRRLECLTELYVHPTFQRGKVGKALLSAVLDPHVPEGWRRIIVAHPTPPALALYARWGTFPLANAWYVVMRPHSPANVRGIERGEQASQRYHTNWVEQIESLCFCNQSACVCVGRWEQMAFMARHLGGTVQVVRRGTTILGVGIRSSSEIGPVLGTTPADALAVAQLLCKEGIAQRAQHIGLWVPGTNTPVLRWLAALPNTRLAIQGQVTIMASDPALVANLDRTLLTAPPYLW